MEDATEHPLRYALVNELHARPSPRLEAPCTAVFLAIKEPQDAANRDRARDVEHLAEFCARNGAPRPDPQAGHYKTTVGRYKLRWESHTEFVTYAAFMRGLPQRPFDPSAGAVFPQDWQARAPGKRVAAVMIQVDFLPDDPREVLPRLEEWFAADSLASVWVLDEAAVVAGDFRIDPAGWMRFAVFVRPGTGSGRIGRIVQRLMELETYRAMSMLGLNRARSDGTVERPRSAARRHPAGHGRRKPPGRCGAARTPQRLDPAGKRRHPARFPLRRHRGL